MIGLGELNALPTQEFVDRLQAIFEHSPWVPLRVAAARPFDSVRQLHLAMCQVVTDAGADEQLTLIRAHPTLGLVGRPPAALTAASSQEQRGAGLAACTAEEAARLAALNSAYMEKFGVPFIMAVRGHGPASIIANCAARLTNEWPVERGTALREIGLIAGFRLADSVTDISVADKNS